MKKKAGENSKDRRKAKRATFEELQMAAYQNWQKRGSPHGDDLTDWLDAERRGEDAAEEAMEEERRWEEKDTRDEEPGEAP